MSSNELYSALVTMSQDIEAKLDKSEQITEQELRTIANTLVAIASWIDVEIDEYSDR